MYLHFIPIKKVIHFLYKHQRKSRELASLRETKPPKPCGVGSW